MAPEIYSSPQLEVLDAVSQKDSATSVPMAAPKQETRVQIDSPAAQAEDHGEANEERHALAPPPVRITLPQFAAKIRFCKHQEHRTHILQRRLRGLRMSIALSARLQRTGKFVHKSLVDSFKRGDKSTFVLIYNNFYDFRQCCGSTFQRAIEGSEVLTQVSSALESERAGPSSFHQKLSSISRQDLTDFLNLVRTSPQFLFDQIRTLTPSQLSVLISSNQSSESGHSVLPFGSSGRSTNSSSKRTSAHISPIKEYGLAFERSDPLSGLLFNVFLAPLDCDSTEHQLRLDVWASTCAKLFAEGGNGYHNLIGHVLSAWTSMRAWRAKPKLELFLMDILQKGAFLLEHIEAPILDLSLETERFDPLQTDAAEEFFESAIQTLFEVLDDSDGGLSQGALELATTILGKMHEPHVVRHFCEFLFLQWFFSRFLPAAIIYPEDEGMLLDHHIGKDAREKILRQVAMRAQTQVSGFLNPMPQFSMVYPTVWSRIGRIFSRLMPKCEPESGSSLLNARDQPVLGLRSATSPSFLALSAPDIVTLLDTLFPKPLPALSSWEPLSPLIASSYAVQSVPTRSDRLGRSFEPHLFQGKLDSFAPGTASIKTPFTTEMSFQDAPRTTRIQQDAPKISQFCRSSFAKRMDKVREELSEIAESNLDPHLLHPCVEDWAIFPISSDGAVLVTDSSAAAFAKDPDSICAPGTDNQAEGGTSETSEDEQMLQAALMRLVEDFDFPQHAQPAPALQGKHNQLSPSLEDVLTEAITHYQDLSNFMDAHYWWDALLALQRLYPMACLTGNDTAVLRPKFLASELSIEASEQIIRGCEDSFVGLKRSFDELNGMMDGLMERLANLRNKMWYMTDVKNSKRYEDAKNVALALKNMRLAAMVPRNESISGSKHRNGSKPSGGSFLPRPEMQTMSMMKASGDQGGPNKLADDQVDLTRKWLKRSAIDNFCKGEERIHRFCFEVRTSVNKLVGETIVDSPDLWSSDLYRKERAMFERQSGRTLPNASALRPSSIASDDGFFSSHQIGYGSRNPDTPARHYNQEISSPLVRKASFQSFASERWRGPKEGLGADTSSIGDSPGRAVSTSTVDSLNTFWSPLPTQAQSATSASSFLSRPPSLFNETQIPRQTDPGTHTKVAFLDNLKQSLISMLLSDLGSPVWSCGSETDAWFSDYLNQERIQRQMERHTRFEKFQTRYGSTDSLDIRGIAGRPANQTRQRRSHSAGPFERAAKIGSFQVQPKCVLSHDCPESSSQMQQQTEDLGFSYRAAFTQLIERFSRHANPFVKLQALHDLRMLVISSLSNPRGQPRSAQNQGSRERVATKIGSTQTSRTRASGHLDISERMRLPLSVLNARSSTQLWDCGGSIASQRYVKLSPSESQVVEVLQDLLRDARPKTLFRDLQFIAAFVPSEILNKTESGKAFTNVGVAAITLKEDVCGSMVEIADRIVAQEVNMRHMSGVPDHIRKPVQSMEDAARMWILTAKEGSPVAQRELAILYLTHPELLPRVTLPLTMPKDTFKSEMMYRRNEDSKSDPQTMCLALHWMQLSANGGDEMAKNRLREREEFDSIL